MSDWLENTCIPKNNADKNDPEKKYTKLNRCEDYLLKLIIHFVREAHLPRRRYFKVMGDLILITADLTHSLNKIIPLEQLLICRARDEGCLEREVGEGSLPPPFTLMSPLKSSQQVANIFLTLKRYEPFCLRKLCLALITYNIERNLITSNLEKSKFNDIFNNLIYSIKNNLYFYEKIKW